MTFSELLGAVLGWVGELIEWLIGWCPRYEIVSCDEVGVKRRLGYDAVELPHDAGWPQGMHWYVPNLTNVAKHHTSRQILPLDGLAMETKDGVKVQIGLVITYFIVDVVAYDVHNYEAESSMEDLAEGALRDAVLEHTWDELLRPTEEGRMLESKLSRRMQKALDSFGVEVETVRPRDQIRLEGAYRIFGWGDNEVSIGGGS